MTHQIYFEVSAKTGENVALAFRELLKETALKKAVSDRLEHERFTEQQKMVKSKSKNKSKGDMNVTTVTKENKSLTADANIDWRVVRLNQLMISSSLSLSPPPQRLKYLFILFFDLFLRALRAPEGCFQPRMCGLRTR